MTHVVFERGRFEFYGAVPDLLRKKYLLPVGAMLKYRNNVSSEATTASILKSQLTYI
jgi:hypothetical protein